jgi:ubiquinone/menaquinone biosynthesis C-methylase UbiE
MTRQTCVIAGDDPAYAGQREYTPRFLRIYDPLVLGLYCRFIWRCPSSRLVTEYECHTRLRHLDIGPGTGDLLRRSTLPSDVSLTLLDPNPNVLEYAARRLAQHKPATLEADSASTRLRCSTCCIAYPGQW